MINSTKNYTKKNPKKTNNKKKDRQNPRTNGKSKAIQTKSYKEAYTYTLPKREKVKKYIYHFSRSPSPQFGMIHCLLRYSTDAGYIKLIVEI